MSKLTEIKRLFQIVKEEDPNAKMAFVKIEIVEYLFSLLEEKDKVLEEQHRYFERISVTFGEFECQRLAKEAMDKFTSSNNEGEA